MKRGKRQHHALSRFAGSIAASETPWLRDRLIRRFVAAHVAAEIDSPDSQQAKIIDVAGQISAAWDQDN